jgi:hypothetical protein
VNGYQNNLKGSYDKISGNLNQIIGNLNLINGSTNTINGTHNIVYGQGNQVLSSLNFVKGSGNVISQNIDLPFFNIFGKNYQQGQSNNGDASTSNSYDNGNIPILPNSINNSS